MSVMSKGVKNRNILIVTWGALEKETWIQKIYRILNKKKIRFELSIITFADFGLFENSFFGSILIDEQIVDLQKFIDKLREKWPQALIYIVTNESVWWKNLRNYFQKGPKPDGFVSTSQRSLLQVLELFDTTWR